MPICWGSNLEPVIPERADDCAIAAIFVSYRDAYAGQRLGHRSLNSKNDRKWLMNRFFSSIAQWISLQCGRSHTFIFAILTIIVWACFGPFFQYSDSWQLVINTGTTIVTFLMVFLIQNTQNRDMAALQIKLDELIRVDKHARNQLFNLENMTDKEIEVLKDEFTVDHRGSARAHSTHSRAHPHPPSR